MYLVARYASFFNLPQQTVDSLSVLGASVMFSFGGEAKKD